MDRLLTVDDLKFVPLGGANPEAVVSMSETQDPGVFVKFRIRVRENGRLSHNLGYVTSVDALHGTPEENARSIAISAGQTCGWVVSDMEPDVDGFVLWKPCEPSD